MIPTCVITAWERRTGTTGDGTPAYTAASFAGQTIPAMLAPVSFARRASASAAGVRLDRALSVEAAALRALGAGSALPGVGDRVSVAARAGAAATAFVVEQVDHGGNEISNEPIPGGIALVRLFLREVA